MKLRPFGFLLALLSGVLCIHEALAYPTSVIFAPNGEVRQFGSLGIFIYTSIISSPNMGPGSTWSGAEIGVIPPLSYGDVGTKFGGLEIGADLLSSDLMGTPDVYLKPLFNMKLQLLTEAHWIPSVAFGLMNVDPFHWNRSLNMVYGSTTKTLGTEKKNYGVLTLGLGGMANHFQNSNDPYRDSVPVFRGSWPFSSSSLLSLLAGYKAPQLGIVSLAIDYIGGISEIGSTNIVLNVTPVPTTSFALGTWLGNDFQKFDAGFFTSIFFQLGSYHYP